MIRTTANHVNFPYCDTSCTTLTLLTAWVDVVVVASTTVVTKCGHDGHTMCHSRRTMSSPRCTNCSPRSTKQPTAVYSWTSRRKARITSPNHRTSTTYWRRNVATTVSKSGHCGSINTHRGAYAWRVKLTYNETTSAGVEERRNLDGMWVMWSLW